MIQQLSSLSLEQKVGQLFFIGVAGPQFDEQTSLLLDEVAPGGVCLFARNIREAAQTRGLLDEIRTSLSVTPFLSIDQEGGLVDRLRRVMTPMPAAGHLTQAAEAAELAAIIAEALRLLGFNMDFAPVVDVMDASRAHHTNGLTTRTFGRSKEDVAAFAGKFLKELQAGGIIGCLKHFPGLGAASVDSHEELPIVEITTAELSENDLFPYRELLAGANVHAVMAAHASFPQVNLQETGQNGKLLPSSLSYTFVTTLLRGELAFDGVVITDDLEMGAIVNNYGIGDACKMAIAAGVDMLAICADPGAVREGYNAVLNAADLGEISADRLDISLGRLARAKNELSLPVAFDTARLDGLSNDIARLKDRVSKPSAGGTDRFA